MSLKIRFLMCPSLRSATCLWRHKLDQIGIATLVWYAKQGGFDARAASRRKQWAGRIRFADPTTRDGLTQKTRTHGTLSPLHP